MKQESNKERKKVSQFPYIIEKNKKMNNPFTKNGYKEKSMSKNKQNNTNYLNTLGKIFNMGELRENIRKKELKYNNKEVLKPNILLNIIIISLLISLTNENLSFRQLNYFSSITITFKETGNMHFLSQEYKFKPDLVLVNDKERDFVQSSDGKFTILLNENEFTIKVGWNNSPSSCGNMFNGIQEITSIDLSEFDTSNVSDMSFMFSECINLEALDIRNLNLSSVTSFNSMFKSCISLKAIDLSNLDASLATTISGMFSHCSSLTYINLSNIKLGSLKDMSYLFYQCESVTRIDLVNLNTKTVETMSFMFSGCKSLKSLNILNFDSSSVIYMEEMFSNNFLLESLDLSSFNTHSLKSMKRMFYKCQNLIYLKLTSFDTSAVLDMSDMFNGCISLEIFNISNFRTTKYTNTNGLFQNCAKLKSLIFPSEIKLLSNSMKYMFQGCKSLTSLDLSHFDTSSVSNMEYMFTDCIELAYINISNINTASVKRMTCMFKNCQKLERMDLSNLNIKSLDNMNSMFYDCKSLLFLNLQNLKLNNIDIGDIFEGNMNPNLKLCYNLSLANTIKNDYENLINECENNCFVQSTKLISELNKCVDECNKDENGYIYEYNDKCYQRCPEDTTPSNYLCIKNSSCEYYSNINDTQCFENVPEGYYILDNDYKIIDECYKNCKTCNKKGYDDNNNYITCKEVYFYEKGNCVDILKNSSVIKDSDANTEEYISLTIKCEKYTDKSLQSGLCITCNSIKGYYPKYSERDNDFINCYQSLEGYYLMMEFFFPCYETCSECLREGTESKHSCTACKEGYQLINEEDKSGNCIKICQYFYFFNESNELQCTHLNQCPVYKSKLVEKKGKCVHNCKDDDTFQFEYNNKCYKECPDPENKIIENYVCINKTEDQITELITDKINEDENNEKPTSQVIQNTEKSENEIITDNIVTSTDKEREQISDNLSTSTNKEIDQISNNISNNKEIEQISDNILTSNNKKTEQISDNILPSNFKETEKTSDNIIASTNKKIEQISDNIATSTNNQEEKIITYDTKTNSPISLIDKNTEIII